MYHSIIKKFLLSVAIAGLSLTAYADYDSAYRAIQNKDFTTAFTLMKQSAEANEVKALQGLGIMYWNGMGTEKNPKEALTWIEKGAAAGNVSSMIFLANLYLNGDKAVPKDIPLARSWAEKAADTGNATGELIYFLSVINGPELNYLSNGKPDMAKYNALAKRSVDARTLEQKAYAMLEKSVAQGLPQAKLYAFATLASNISPDNKTRALALLQNLPSIPDTMQPTKRALEQLLSIGDSYTSIRTFSDAKNTALLALNGLAKKIDHFDINACPANQWKIVKTTVSRPLANAVYLPVKEPLLMNVYLISGNWQETWTFNLCGQEVPVPIEFQADGMGGAYFQSKSKP